MIDSVGANCKRKAVKITEADSGKQGKQGADKYPRSKNTRENQTCNA